MLQAGTGSLQGGTGDGVWTSGKMGNGVELSAFTAIWDGNPFFSQPCRVHPTKATLLPMPSCSGVSPSPNRSEKPPSLLCHGLCCKISLQLAKSIHQFSEILLYNIQAAFWPMWAAYFRKWLEFGSKISQIAGRGREL